ncbi:hypothetical protein KAU33_04510 [Candidatus Dependentiae bacterium]|nr:hypothetical protein [Candidatus Dependentiae bacterium]
MSEGKGYFERTGLEGVAPKHSKAALDAASKKRAASISSAEVRPTPTKLFTYENVEDVKEQLRNGLDFPFVHVQSSILGGKEKVSIIVKVSKDPKEEWANGIFQNSRYATLHIMSNGTVEQFSGWQLKMRKFKGKSIDHVIEKINKIKVVE